MKRTHLAEDSPEFKSKHRANSAGETAPAMSLADIAYTTRTLTDHWEKSTIGTMRQTCAFWNNFFTAPDMNTYWQSLIARDIPGSRTALNDLAEEIKAINKKIAVENKKRNTAEPEYIVDYALMYKRIVSLKTHKILQYIYKRTFDEFYFTPQRLPIVLRLCLDKNEHINVSFPADEAKNWIELAIILHRNDLVKELSDENDYLSFRIAATSNNVELIESYSGHISYHELVEGLYSIAAEAGNRAMLGALKRIDPALSPPSLQAIASSGNLSLLQDEYKKQRRKPTDLLQNAIESGNLVMVRWLVEKHEFVPTHENIKIAMANDNIEMVDYFIKHFKYALDSSIDNNFYNCVLSYSKRMQRCLHQHHVRANYFSNDLYPLIVAKHCESSEFIRQIEQGYLTLSTELFYSAIESGCLKKVTYLAERHPDRIDKNLIEHAIALNYLNIVKFLLEKNPSAWTHDYSLQSDQIALIEFFLDPNHVPKNAKIYVRGSDYGYQLYKATANFRSGISSLRENNHENAQKMFKFSFMASPRQFFLYATHAYFDTEKHGLPNHKLQFLYEFMQNCRLNFFDALHPNERAFIFDKIKQLVSNLESTHRTSEAADFNTDFLNTKNDEDLMEIDQTDLMDIEKNDTEENNDERRFQI